MNQQSYKLLCDDLEQLASEVSDDKEPACDFSEDAQELFEMAVDFNSIWEGR